VIIEASLSPLGVEYQAGTTNSTIPLGLRTVAGVNLTVRTQFEAPITSEFEDKVTVLIVPAVKLNDVDFSELTVDPQLA